MIQKGNVSQKPPEPNKSGFTGPPSPSLIDFNKRLCRGRMASFIGLMGLFSGPTVSEHCSTYNCLFGLPLVCGFQNYLVTQSQTYSMSWPLPPSLTQTFSSFTCSIISSLNHWPTYLYTHLFIPPLPLVHWYSRQYAPFNRLGSSGKLSQTVQQYM